MPHFTGDFEKEFEDGELIFPEGDESREMYIIQEGAILIKKKMPSGGELKLAKFERGDFVGEMALLESLPRFAAAYALGKTKVLILRPGGFLLKIRRDPTFAFEMLQQLSRRIRITNERLVELVSKGNVPADAVSAVLEQTEAKYNEKEDLSDGDFFKKDTKNKPKKT